jgi:hypothetical protein
MTFLPDCKVLATITSLTDDNEPGTSCIVGYGA